MSIDEAAYKECFAFIDTQKSGFISASDFAFALRAMGNAPSESECKELLEANGGSDADGIGLDEVGVIAAMATPLAQASVPVLYVSAFSNDYVLVPAALTDVSVDAFEKQGFVQKLFFVLYEDKVLVATVDAFVVALNARTGEVEWETAVEDYRRGYYMTLAPLVADGHVMVGVSGGEFGIRGFVMALDADTGEISWKTYTIPEPGEFGNDTWPGDSW